MKRHQQPKEARLADALSAIDPPGADDAEAEAWGVVSQVHSELEWPRVRPRTTRRLTLAAAGAGLIAVLALTPAGARIGDWIGDAIDPGEPDARPLLDVIPGSGSILADTPDGAWVVRAASRDRIGDYDRVTWSPNGLYVGAAKDRELSALTPQGEVRWTLTAPARIRSLDWSPGEGYRIAYVAGDELRVVAGDGTDDRAAVEKVRSTAIAWRPDSDPGTVTSELAYVDSGGRVVLADTDAGKTLWRSAPIGTPIDSLQWSDDGGRLMVSLNGSNFVYSATGVPVVKAVGFGSRAAAIAPDGGSIAFVRSDRRHGSELLLQDVGTAPDDERILYRGPGDAPFGTPVFSPDGDWILLPWPQADQWLFIRIDDRRVVAIADITRQLDDNPADQEAGFPRVAGWCC